MTHAEPIWPHSVWVEFDDGLQGVVDARLHLWGAVFQPLRDPEVFVTGHFDPDAGTIVWPGDVDIAPEVLYERVIKDPTCPACQIGEHDPVKRPQVKERADGSLVVVRDVPVRECQICGHTAFDPAVLERFDTIVESAPTGSQVIVVDWST